MKTELETQLKTEAAKVFSPTPHGVPLWIILGADLLVFVSLILQYGFPIPSRVAWWLRGLDVLLAACFVADLVIASFQARNWRSVLAQRRFDYVMLALFAFLIALSWLVPAETVDRVLHVLQMDSVLALRIHSVQLFLLSCLGIQLLRFTQRLFVRGVRPEMILAGTFAALILMGTLLLALPNSSAGWKEPIRLVDAVFTSTSAACVTGLVVRDTGTDFSTFGQLIILAVFQVGGLGIITFAAFLSLLSSKSLPVPQMVAFRQIINAPALSALKRQVLGIVLATVLIEAVGAALMWSFLEGDSDPLHRLKWALFHTVSAFCNAGFALQGDSLEAYRAHFPMMMTFMILIVLGGLGFLVIPELVGFRLTRIRFFRRFALFRRLYAGYAPARLSVQTKLSLIVTAALLLAGLVGFWALEANHILRGRSGGESFLIAAFQSVTPRTAGFNTVPIHELRDATLVFLMVLMVIGACPVSTGGGIKTVTFGILLLALRAMVTRRERVEVFGRTLPVNVLFAALSVFVMYVMSASVGIFLLALFDPEMNLRDQIFEVISALSTVGLSTGITAKLSDPSKLVLCLMMFVGRVGPISLVLSVFQSRRTLTYEFPEEPAVVG